MEEFLREIGINDKGTMSDDGCYVIDFEDDTAWSKAFSKLDKCEEIEEDTDSSNVTYESSTVQYVNDDYTVTLLADLEGDTYRLVMREN